MVTIVISGPPGSGKSTVARLLSEKLNVPVVSAGAIFRELAKEMGMSLIELNEYAKENISVDLRIDKRTLDLSKSGDVIIEGHLTAWMSPYADIRVYLTAPLEIRAKRISERDSIPFEEAKLNIIRREKAHWERFKALYGIDITDLSIFDLVVNTAMFKAEEIADFILSALRRP